MKTEGRVHDEMIYRLSIIHSRQSEGSEIIAHDLCNTELKQFSKIFFK